MPKPKKSKPTNSANTTLQNSVAQTLQASPGAQVQVNTTTRAEEKEPDWKRKVAILGVIVAALSGIGVPLLLRSMKADSNPGNKSEINAKGSTVQNVQDSPQAQVASGTNITQVQGSATGPGSVGVNQGTVINQTIVIQPGGGLVSPSQWPDQIKEFTRTVTGFFAQYEQQIDRDFPLGCQILGLKSNHLIIPTNIPEKDRVRADWDKSRLVASDDGSVRMTITNIVAPDGRHMEEITLGGFPVPGQALQPAAISHGGFRMITKVYVADDKGAILAVGFRKLTPEEIARYERMKSGR